MRSEECGGFFLLRRKGEKNWPVIMSTLIGCIVLCVFYLKKKETHLPILISSRHEQWVIIKNGTQDADRIIKKKNRKHHEGNCTGRCIMQEYWDGRVSM